MGFIFVPLTTTTMGDLPNEQMGNAAGMFNLMRNIGGSIGISMATTMVARGAQAHQALMVGHLTPYDPQFQQRTPQAAAGLWRYGGPLVAQHRAYGLLDGTMMQQALLGLRRYLPHPGGLVRCLRALVVGIPKGSPARRRGGRSLRQSAGNSLNERPPRRRAGELFGTPATRARKRAQDRQDAEGGARRKSTACAVAVRPSSS